MLSKRDTFVRYVDPLNVFWEDADGVVHASIDNACAAFGLEPTDENRREMTDVVRRILAQHWPKTQIVVRSSPDSPDFYDQ